MLDQSRLPEAKHQKDSTGNGIFSIGFSGKCLQNTLDTRSELFWSMNLKNLLTRIPFKNRG